MLCVSSTSAAVDDWQDHAGMEVTPDPGMRKSFPAPRIQDPEVTSPTQFLRTSLGGSRN